MTPGAKEKPPAGMILEIQRMSTEDGPGLRTTVFFKGCPLACGWCHNPESLSPRPQIQWTGVGCLGCGACVETCPNGSLFLDSTGIHIDRRLCDGCGVCVDECPSGAMELLGTFWNLGDLVNELVKDRTYFEQSDGGITLSGGEATMQPEFCRSLLSELEKQGIRTALDTCGQVSRGVFATLLPLTDLLLFDLKEIDVEKHRRFTGRSNELILENAVFAAEYIRRHKRPRTFWIRTPLIPGATATAENIQGIGAFIAGHLEGTVDRWELCAFNNLCRDKYERLGIHWDYAPTPLLSREQMESFAAEARRSGVDPSIVIWSGSTLTEDEGRNNKLFEGKAESTSNVIALPGCGCPIR